MTADSHEHRIRVALGQAFHHKHRTKSGSVNIENIASEQGVSEDQVREQYAYLRQQHLVGGPMAGAGEQVADIPADVFDDHHLTEDGVAWANAGFPVI